MGTFEPSQKKSSYTATIPTNSLFRSRPFSKPSTTTEETSTDAPDFQAQLDFARSHAPNLNSLAANSSRPSTIQPKLTVGAPNDVYEQEADRVADRVMSMPDSAVQQLVQRSETDEDYHLTLPPFPQLPSPLPRLPEYLRTPNFGLTPDMGYSDGNLSLGGKFGVGMPLPPMLPKPFEQPSASYMQTPFEGVQLPNTGDQKKALGSLGLGIEGRLTPEEKSGLIKFGLEF